MAFVAAAAAGPPASRSATSPRARRRALAGTEDATFPFWSPDGRWIAFFADKRLRKVEARRPGADRLRGRGRPRRELETGRHDRLRARHHGPARPGSRWGRRPRRRRRRPRPRTSPTATPGSCRTAATSCSRAARARARPSRRSPSGPWTAASRGSCSSGARTRSTPTASSSPWSTATWWRSASTPGSWPSRDSRLPDRRRARVLQPPRPRPVLGVRAGLLVYRRRASGRPSSCGSTAPARSWPRWESPPTTATLQLGADGRTLVAVRRDASGADARRLGPGPARAR